MRKTTTKKYIASEISEAEIEDREREPTKAQFYKIVATHSQTGERYECMTWWGRAQDGIARAKDEAPDFGMGGLLKDYRAEPMPAPHCIGCDD